MKKLSLVSRSTACTLGLALISTAACAQSPDALYIGGTVTAGASAITSAVNNFFAGMTSKIDSDWKAVQPNLEKITGVINPEGVTLSTNQASSVNGLVSQVIGGEVGPTLNPTISISLLGQVAGDVLPPLPINAAGKIAQNCGNMMFNFESLLGYSSYANQVPTCNPNASATDISSYANFYIQFAADLASPPAQFSLTQNVANNTMTLAQAQTLQQSPEFTAYQTSLRHLVAVQSAGLSNLYYLYSQRVPDANGNSPESVSNYLANWRSQNPSWYASMGSALPTVLMRETLFVLTEMQRDLHEMRKENQRLLASQSIGLLQSVQVSKAMLPMKVSGLQTKMQNIVNPPATTSGSTSSGGSSSTNSSDSNSSNSALDKINAQSSSSSDEALKALGVQPTGTTSTSSGK